MAKKAADYFGTDQKFELVLPDGVSKIFHKKLTEGDRKQYLDASTRGFSMDPDTRRMFMSGTAGTSKHVLLKLAICGWEMYRGDVQVPFNDAILSEFLEKADPSVIDVIEKDIRGKNPWIVAAETPEKIEKKV